MGRNIGLDTTATTSVEPVDPVDPVEPVEPVDPVEPIVFSSRTIVILDLFFQSHAITFSVHLQSNPAARPPAVVPRNGV